jgi:hypothetical protein
VKLVLSFYISGLKRVLKRLEFDLKKPVGTLCVLCDIIKIKVLQSCGVWDG